MGLMFLMPFLRIQNLVYFSYEALSRFLVQLAESLKQCQDISKSLADKSTKCNQNIKI